MRDILISATLTVIFIAVLSYLVACVPSNDIRWEYKQCLVAEYGNIDGAPYYICYQYSK